MLYLVLGGLVVVLVLLLLLLRSTRQAAKNEQLRKQEEDAARDMEQVSETLTEAPPKGADLRDSIARRSGLLDDD